MNAAGLWDELKTDWIVLDAELLPWSAKAVELLKSQYAATGTAATTMLAAASSVLDQAVSRGIEEVADLGVRTQERQTHAERYVDAYRQYC